MRLPDLGRVLALLGGAAALLGGCAPPEPFLPGPRIIVPPPTATAARVPLETEPGADWWRLGR